MTEKKKPQVVEETAPIVTEQKRETFIPYFVRANRGDVLIREKPNEKGEEKGYLQKGIHAIVDEKDGYGLLREYEKEQDGWILLSNCTKA